MQLKLSIGIKIGILAGRNILIALTLANLPIHGGTTAKSNQAASGPANSKNHCGLGKNQVASGEVLEAIRTLEKCLDREPNNREAWLLLANASLEAGKFAISSNAFAKAQALKPGDVAFLTSYLSALDGAGNIPDQVEILKILHEKVPGDRITAERFLAAVEAAGPEKFPEEYLAVLQALSRFPSPELLNIGKLAAVYMGLGSTEKAEAEYRGLLEKQPEVSEYWAGLAAAQAKRDPKAAVECYRKATLFSNQETQRQFYRAEGQRLTKSASAPQPAPAFNIKAFQDSVYKAELEKRMAALHQSSTPVVPSTNATAIDAKAEKAKQDQLAKERGDRFVHALALYYAGKMDSAGIVFNAVLADSPIVEAYYYAGRVNLETKQYSQAIARFNKTSQDRSDLNGLKAKAWMGLGKPREALQAMEAQYAGSKNDSLLEDLVLLKRKNGDEAGAIVYLEKLGVWRPTVETYQLELGAYFQKKGNKVKAAIHYANVLALNPNHGEANVFLGLQAFERGDMEHALPLLEKAVAVFPKRVDLWKALGKANAGLGRKQAGLEAYKRAFALAPADLDLARAKLGLTLEAEKPENFVQAYEDVLKLSPKDKDASLGLGRLRFLSGNFAAAENHFRIACSDSKDAMALAQFGRTLVELKKLDEAAPVLQKAIDLGNEDAAIRYDLARIRMEKGDLDWAESIIKDLAKKSPKDPEPLFWQGQIAIKRQQGPVAEEFFRSANRLQPMVGRYAEALATLSRDRDDFKMAMLSLNQAQADLTPSGRLLWADCLAHEGDGSKAMEVYTELYKRHPSDLLLAKRMDLWVKLGRPEQAVGLLTGSPLKAAVAVQFSLAKAQLALATARILKGDLDLAEDLLNKVVKSNSHNPEYHYYLGRVYFGQNRMKKARDEFIAALLYRMDFPDALLHQGLCQLKLDELMDAENSFGELSQHAEPIWKARGYYGLALLFEQKGKMDAVAGHLERSITIWPLPESMVHMSRIRLKEGKVVEAEELAKKSLMADPNSEDATVALAQALAAGKRQNEAMELAQQGLRARPLSCGLLVQSAKLTFDAGKLDSALAVSSNAIRICPEEPMGYYYAGVATHGINRPKEAKQYFKSFKKLGGDEKLVPGR